MKFEIQDFSYTMEKATEDARKYYKKTGNKKVVHRDFYTCKSSSINKYINECKAKYSDVHIFSCEKEINWANDSVEFTDVSFSIKVPEEKLEDAVKELAKKLYKDSIEHYEKAIKWELELVKWELAKKYKENK